MLKGTEQVRPGITPPPIVRVIGYDRDDPRAHAVIQANIGRLQQFVNAQRQAYALSLGEIAPQGRRSFDDVAFTYDNVQGTETVTITPRVGELVPPPRERPARWLVLEFVWEDDRETQLIPFLYITGNARWNLWFVHIPGYPIGEGFFAFGQIVINGADAEQDVPALVGVLGKAAPKEIIYASSLARYRRFHGGGLSVPGYITGENSYVLFIPDTPQDGIGYDPPGNGPVVVPEGDRDRYRNYYRSKGIKELHPHTLLFRVNQALEEDKGEGVGVTPNFDPPWDYNDLTDFNDGTFKLYYGRATNRQDGYDPNRETYSVAIDLKKYEQKYGPQLKVQCTGFWRSAENFVHPTYGFSGPDVDFPAQQWFGDQPSAQAYIDNFLSLTDPTAWSRVQENIPPHPVDLQATLLYGPEDFEEYLYGADTYQDTGRILCTKTISASQPRTQERSAPDVPPWGDIFGTVTLDIRQSLLGFVKDK